MPKRKPASEVPVQEVSSPKKPKQVIDNVFDVPTADVPVNNSPVEPTKKTTTRKPRTKKQALSQKPAVPETSLPQSEGEPSSSTQIPANTSQEPPPPETPSFAPDVIATPEKKPRKPRTKKQNANPDPLSINNLLIHTPQEPETAQIIPQFINVTNAVSVKKPENAEFMDQPMHHENNSTIHSSIATANQKEIESQEPTVVPQEQPVKKQRKTRTKKQELPQEHSITDDAISSSQQPNEFDNVINNAQQVFDVQMKPKTRTPKTRKSKVTEVANPQLNASSSALDNKDDTSIHDDDNAQKASSTKRGRPRKEKVPELTSHDDTNTSSNLVNESDEHTQKISTSKRGRPRKEKNPEIIPTSNEPETFSTVLSKEHDTTTAHAEEHLQRAPSSKRGRPRKVEQSLPDEYPVGTQSVHIGEERPAEEESASSKKRRGRPKKDDLSQDVTQSNDSTHGESFSEGNIHSTASTNHRQSDSFAANKSPGITKKRNKKLDSPQIHQLPEKIDHGEISKDLHPVSNQKWVNSSSVGAEKYDSHFENTYSNNQQHQFNKGVIQHTSYPKEEFQQYYGNSLDVLASVSVGDTMMQGISTDEHYATRNTFEERVKEPERATNIDASHYTSSQPQQSYEDTTKSSQMVESEKDTKSIEQGETMKVTSEDIVTTGDDSERESSKKPSPVEKMKSRFEHLQKLRSRKDEAEQANRQELYDEHQRKKINPRDKIRQERKREEAEKLLARQEAEEKGEDYERKQFWNYSVESVEKWEKKQEKKLKRSDIAFTDYNQVAHKKYKRMINDFTPDLASYNAKKETARASASLVTTEDGEVVPIDAESSFYRDANSLQYASVDDQPSREAIDRLVNDVEKQIDRREKFSRQKAVNEDDDITYINERNRKFNEKIGRFYDKYTQEIKENFERGTAMKPEVYLLMVPLNVPMYFPLEF
ncbi:6949_t:CDS:2 [Acaulospora morrowiae]|uniref:Pre-mRNA-splicing factor SYF2 n=1 Tax=Acaulospora morrowiae TaxID=94023 RepID=A0A9N8ZG37_9GLOM|nr:6949_t:CDS:2 [Acaulospora morrowiae]